MTPELVLCANCEVAIATSGNLCVMCRRAQKPAPPAPAGYVFRKRRGQMTSFERRSKVKLPARLMNRCANPGCGSRMMAEQVVLFVSRGESGKLRGKVDFAFCSYECVREWADDRSGEPFLPDGVSLYAETGKS